MPAAAREENELVSGFAPVLRVLPLAFLSYLETKDHGNSDCLDMVPLKGWHTNYSCCCCGDTALSPAIM